jgi:hypothetical protein
MKIYFPVTIIVLCTVFNCSNRDQSGKGAAENLTKADSTIAPGSGSSESMEGIEVDNNDAFITRYVFSTDSLKSASCLLNFEIIASDEVSEKFTAITDNGYVVTGQIVNDEDLHTAVLNCYKDTLAVTCDGINCEPLYLQEINHLAKIFIKDQILVKMIRCAKNNKLTLEGYKTTFRLFTNGGNLNELSAMVTNSANQITINLTVRDIGDLIKFTVCD